MSIKALTWAFDQDIPSSSCKFILVAMADYANEDWCCYPSTETICRKTSLDRKTVLCSIERLVDASYLQDTNERKGATKQVRVFRILELSQKRNGSNFPDKRTKNGTVKRSQKRDTDPSLSLTIINHQEVSQSSTYPEGDEIFIPSKTQKQKKDGNHEDMELGFDSGASVITPAAPRLKSKPNELDILSHNLSLAIKSRWNESGLPKVIDMSAKRKQAIKKILKENGAFSEQWPTAILYASRSDFLMGRSKSSGKHSGWKISMDWFLNAENFNKILEGRYGGTDEDQPPTVTYHM